MDSLSKETLELIQSTAVAASGAPNKVLFVNPAAEPTFRYAAVKPDGTYQLIDAAPGSRDHSLVTLEQVASFVAKKGTEKGTVVWYDREGVMVIVDDSTRRDRAALSLATTPQLKTLQALESTGKKMNLVAFRRLLRVDLAGCFVDRVLHTWLANVKFIDNRAGQSMVKQGKESLGRAIEQEAVSSAGECPEEVTLKVRVFDDPSLTETWPIDCAVEIDLEAQAFSLTPLPLQLHNAIENEVGAIGAALRETIKCPVFRGMP